MDTIRIATIDDVHEARPIIRRHFSPAPLIRSYALESHLGLQGDRRVWLKDYGWTPVRSFKLMGALNWMDHRADEIGDRPVAAHSSGNFASGIAYAGMKYQKQVIIVMPDDAPQTKFELTRSFGADIRTYHKATDHETGAREKLTREIAEELGGVQASPYNDPFVIAGNGVGGLEIVDQLTQGDRTVSQFYCQVSGGGLMAGHALAIANAFPDARIVGVEPDGADDFRQSMIAGQRVRVDLPTSICDGLLSYDVGEHNWPILREHVSSTCVASDQQTQLAMRWLYENHGLRTEPSGAIALAAMMNNAESLEGDGDIVVVVSGRNVDNDAFLKWIA